MIYTDDENTLFLNGVEYEAVLSYDDCHSCDLYDIVGKVCNIKCYGYYDRKDGKYVVWKRKELTK